MKRASTRRVLFRISRRASVSGSSASPAKSPRLLSDNANAAGGGICSGGISSGIIPPACTSLNGSTALTDGIQRFFRSRAGKAAGMARQAVPVTIVSATALDGKVPPFWRRVDDGLFCSAKSKQKIYKKWRETFRLWELICEALHIPYVTAGEGIHQALFVPPLYERQTRRHFSEVATEGRLHGLRPPPPPAHHNEGWALAALSLLMLWHGVIHNWWSVVPSINTEDWIAAGALDVWKTLHGEAYRALTALTLHADSGHLFANMLFGTPFFILLCRRAGVGGSMALTLTAGTLGNLMNAFYRQTAHVSLGFSTALFGIVGVYVALLVADELRFILRVGGLPPRIVAAGLRRAFVFLAAGVAVLAFLGADPSSRTDYAAHIFGLLAGLGVGLAVGLSKVSLLFSPRAGLSCALLSIAAVTAAWFWAL